MNNQKQHLKALDILYDLEDKLQYDCPEISKAIDLLQGVTTK